MTRELPRLILASQSPRRKQLLDLMGLAGKYEVIPSEFVEELDDARSPQEVAEELGYGKALWVAKRNPGAWAIGSDTIVTVRGRQLGKAASEAEARQMLSLLAGEMHVVTSSLALVMVKAPQANGELVVKHFIGSESSRVYFKPYDRRAVDAYIESGDWHDKAGAYGLQSGAHTLISHIAGNYDTIVGLPTQLLSEYLRQAGILSASVKMAPPVPQIQ